MVAWGKFDLSRSLLSPTMRRGLISGTIDPGIATAQAGITQLEGAIAALPDGPQKEAYKQQLQQTQGTLQTLEGAKGYLNNTMNQSLVSAKLKGDADVAVGVNAGFLWDITDEWSVGMTYRFAPEYESGQRPCNDEHRPAGCGAHRQTRRTQARHRTDPVSTRAPSTPNCRFRRP